MDTNLVEGDIISITSILSKNKITFNSIKTDVYSKMLKSCSTQADDEYKSNFQTETNALIYSVQKNYPGMVDYLLQAKPS